MLPESVKDINLEKAVIGGCLNDVLFLAQACSDLNFDNFYDPKNIYIFKSISDLFKAGEQVTLHSVMKQVEKDTGNPIPILYLSEIIKENKLKVSYQGSIEQMSKMAKLRYLHDLSYAFLEECKGKKSVKDDYLKDYGLNVSKIFFGSNKVAENYSNDLAKVQGIERLELYKKSQEYFRKTGCHYRPEGAISTGIEDLDKSFLGLAGDRLMTIAAKSGGGKTTFALNMVAHITQKLKKNVLYIAFEGQESDYQDKLTCIVAGLNKKKLFDGISTKDDLEKYEKANQQIADSKGKVIWLTRKVMNANEVHYKILQYQMTNDIDIVFIDHMAKMAPIGKANDLYTKITENVQTIKNSSISLNIPIVGLHQFSKEVGKRGGNRPTANDLIGSSAVEQESDYILLLYNKSEFEENTPINGVTELIMAKDRHDGDKSPVFVNFNRDTTNYEKFSYNFEDMDE